MNTNSQVKPASGAPIIPKGSDGAAVKKAGNVKPPTNSKQNPVPGKTTAGTPPVDETVKHPLSSEDTANQEVRQYPFATKCCDFTILLYSLFMEHKTIDFPILAITLGCLELLKSTSGMVTIDCTHCHCIWKGKLT